MGSNIVNSYSEEKNLIDLLKVLVKNRSFIVKVSFISLFMGMSFYFVYDKVKPLRMEQKFYLSFIDRMEEMQIAGVPINPDLVFKDNNFIDLFFQEDFIKNQFKGSTAKEKRGFIQSKLQIKVEKIKTDRFLYTLTTKGKGIEESRKWANLYFKILNTYIEKQNRLKLDKEYQIMEKKSLEYRGKLQEIENSIKALVKIEKKENLAGIVSLAEEIREKNPRIFSEKDVYSELYNEIFKQKEELKQFLDFLDENLEYRSSLVESAGKLNLAIAILVSFTVGILLSIIYLLGKDYFKGVNWE